MLSLSVVSRKDTNLPGIGIICRASCPEDRDRGWTQEIMDMLRTVNKMDHQTVIIVTHEQEIANQTDRRILFRDGVISKDERTVG